MIDGGKPRWVEEQPPYTFSDDENGAHKGYLVTSWLSPGTHRFTVRAVASDGRRSADTVVARVRRAPTPPGELGGVWQRTLSDTSDAPEAGSAGNPTDTYTPKGTYEMVIDRRWIQVRWPGKYEPPQSDKTGYGWITDSDYTATPTTLRALGAVTFDTHHGQAELGWWCWPDGPAGDLPLVGLRRHPDVEAPGTRPVRGARLCLGRRLEKESGMKRLGIGLVLGLLAVAPTGLASSGGRTLCVGHGHQCFATIQAAVDAAHDGDTVAVAPGRYAGGVTIDKSIRLAGAGARETVIKGGGPVVTVGVYLAPDPPTVTISGVTITGGRVTSSPASESYGKQGVVAFGGGIEVSFSADRGPGAALTVKDSVITGNTAAPTATVPSQRRRLPGWRQLSLCVGEGRRHRQRGPAHAEEHGRERQHRRGRRQRRGRRRYQRLADRLADRRQEPRQRQPRGGVQAERPLRRGRRDLRRRRGEAVDPRQFGERQLRTAR